MLLVGRKCRHGCRLAAVQTAVWLLLQAPSSIIAQTHRETETKAAAANVIEYRRATLGARGEVSRGRRLFENAARTRCRLPRRRGRGATLGPDLAGLGGGRVGPAEILDAILEPSAKIHPDYASTVVALKSGRVLQGLLRPVSETEVEVVTSATETVRLARSDIEEQSPSRVSLMPTGLTRVFSPGEMADLLAHLATLEPASLRVARRGGQPARHPAGDRPVSFRPIVERDEPFHRPVWFGPLPGHPGTSAVIEMQRGRVWLLEADGNAARSSSTS